MSIVFERLCVRERVVSIVFEKHYLNTSPKIIVLKPHHRDLQCFITGHKSHLLA